MYAEINVKGQRRKKVNCRGICNDEISKENHDQLTCMGVSLFACMHICEGNVARFGINPKAERYHYR